MVDAYKNLAIGTVATAPSPATSGTSLVLTAGQGARFPATPFDVTLFAPGTIPDPSNAEIARCTAVSTDTLTLTRGQYGTTAQAVAVGWIVDNAVTANFIGQILAYVDAAVQGLSIKDSCQEATAAALPANTYAAGVITITATGVLTVDGQTVNLNDRVLVKNEATAANNGIYTCTTAGAVGVAAVLTRASDSNTSAEIVGAFTFVEAGTVNASSGWVNTNTGTITIGTTSITYTQFSGAGEITAGTGITKSGNTLAVDSTVVAELTAVQTLTSKRITRRVSAVSAPGATPSMDTDNYDFFDFTGLATAITSMTTSLTGTPVNGDLLWIAFTDNGTARGITWGASFESSTVALPTTTTASTRMDVLLAWNTVTSKWRCLAVS